MGRFVEKLRGAILRVVPGCLTQAQAVAFVMFLSFFPLLLVALGLLMGSGWAQNPALELPEALLAIMPPGSGHLIAQFLQGLGLHPGKLIWLGLGGTLLVGTQVMVGLIHGFRIVWHDARPHRFWRERIWGLALLCVTIAPWLATIVLTVFGKQLREWMIEEIGVHVVVRLLWAMLYDAATLAVSFLVMLVLYWLGQPSRRPSSEVLPGAVLATVLWWLLNAGFGLYVRHMPYSVVYGSLTAVIGLMVWMYFMALVVMMGAAYNAEVSARHVATRLNEWHAELAETVGSARLAGRGPDGR
jgi:membrane protein